MSSLSLRNVKKNFGDHVALRGIDLEIESGSLLVLLGPSGCGKSTLLNLIAGLETVSDGDIRIADRVVNDVHPKDRNVAMVFQSYALYPTMSVLNNITFGLKMRGIPRAEREAAARTAADILHIGHLLHRRPAQLSGGQRQRVAMGRALVREPKVFLFDEPLSNLDAQLRVDMRTEIKRLHQRLGTTIIYVTHDQIEAMTLATCIAVMNEGRIIQFGTPSEIYQRPASKFVASFVGSPATNFVPVELRAEKGKLFAVGKNCGGKLVLPTAANAKSAATFNGREVILGVRPEGVSLGTGAKSPAEIDVEIEIVEPTGPDTLVTFPLGGVSVMARLKPHDVSEPGPAKVAFDPEQFHFFDPVSEERIEIE